MKYIAVYRHEDGKIIMKFNFFSSLSHSTRSCWRLSKRYIFVLACSLQHIASYLLWALRHSPVVRTSLFHSRYRYLCAFVYRRITTTKKNTKCCLLVNNLIYCIKFNFFIKRKKIIFSFIHCRSELRCLITNIHAWYSGFWVWDAKIYNENERKKYEAFSWNCEWYPFNTARAINQQLVY